MGDPRKKLPSFFCFLFHFHSHTKPKAKTLLIKILLYSSFSSRRENWSKNTKDNIQVGDQYLIMIQKTPKSNPLRQNKTVRDPYSESVDKTLSLYPYWQHFGTIKMTALILSFMPWIRIFKFLAWWRERERNERFLAKFCRAPSSDRINLIFTGHT